jgi:AhpD family alkylhydroperoxidase
LKVHAKSTPREITMDARLDYSSSEILQKFAKHINAAGGALLAQSVLPPATQNLVLVRASQINGCSVCLDMHTKDAAHAGETPLRLALVAAWRDAKVFTDAERAALEVTEQGPASPTRPAASPTRPGLTPPGIMTPTSLPRSRAPSPSSTRTTG